MDENGSIDISVVDLTYAAFLLPPLIALINQKSWRKEYKGLVFFAVCIVYSTFVVILRGEVDDLIDNDNLLAVASDVAGVTEVVDALRVRWMEARA